MLTTIQSEALKVTVSSRGAELQSILGRDGTEYLWQGDPRYWTSRAPNIFPYVARLTEGKYIYRGREYGFGNHGLTRYADLSLTESSASAANFRFDSDAETLKQYPFPFRYEIRYEAQGPRLLIRTTVRNTGEDRMFFAVGGHPGFRVPLEEGLSFEDYCLEFDETAHPDRIFLADSGAVTLQRERFALDQGRRIPLRHDLFDHDAIVLHHAARTVTICSDRGKRRLRVSYPDFRYVGFWHKPRTDASYVCVEPWTSLPSREGVVEHLALQSDLLHLDPGESWKTEWWIEIA